MKKLRGLANDTKIALAEAGLQYMGFLGIGCLWCQASMRTIDPNKTDNYEPIDGEKLIKMHKKASPRCTFVAKFDPIAFPGWECNVKRAKSFDNDEWQRGIDKPKTLNNEQWAEMGVFFDEDCGAPTCFACGYPYFFTGENWTTESIAINHAYEQPRCGFLLKIKGIAFIEKYKAQPFTSENSHIRKLMND